MLHERLPKTLRERDHHVIGRVSNTLSKGSLHQLIVARENL